MRQDICAIVVTFFPQHEHLDAVLTRIRQQCSIVVVDNSDGSCDERLKDLADAMNFDLVLNGRNLGIAAAQNLGVNFALRNGQDYVLLLDQDSILEPDYVSTLALFAEKNAWPVVSGRAIDERNRDISNTRIKSRAAIEQRDLMSSGTLISKAAIKKVGLFEEALFIDCVDFEWGWRAQSLGLKLYLVRDACFSHTLGDGQPRYSQLPSSIRHYYQSRNLGYMLQRSYVPLFWKLKQILFAFLKIFKILMFASNKKKRFDYIVQGLLDFTKNHHGAYETRDS